MLRQKSCSKFRSITGRQRIIYATVEKLFQIQLYQQPTEGSFMLRLKSCYKFRSITGRQTDYLCYDRKAVPIQIQHWQTEGFFMLRQKSCSKFSSISSRQKDHLCYGRKAVPNLALSVADRRIIFATVEKLLQIQIHHWQTDGLFMLRQESCSKFRSITGRQTDYLCYDRKAVPIQIHHWQTDGYRSINNPLSASDGSKLEQLSTVA